MLYNASWNYSDKNSANMTLMLQVLKQINKNHQIKDDKLKIIEIDTNQKSAA